MLQCRRSNKTAPTGAVCVSLRAASILDERLLAAWEAHPHRVVVDSAESFLDKLSATLRLLRDELPACCRDHIAAPP